MKIIYQSLNIYNLHVINIAMQGSFITIQLHSSVFCFLFLHMVYLRMSFRHFVVLQHTLNCTQDGSTNGAHRDDRFAAAIPCFRDLVLP